MTKNQAHEWHERTEEGGKRYVRAYWDSRQWVFHYLIEPHMPGWLPMTKPSDEDWLMLRDLLFRKYQRKKLPFKYIEKMDALLETMGLKEKMTNDE